MVVAASIAAAVAVGCGRGRRSAVGGDRDAAGGRDAAIEAGDQLAVVDRALARGAAFLATRQEADGAIRSPTYAAFRDGYALTGLAAMALGLAPGDPARQAYPRAVDFLATLVDEQGGMRAPEPAYPTYAAALGVLVLNAPGNQRHGATRDALREVLRRRQLGPALGWRPDDAAYGGWGYYPREPRRPAGSISDDLLSSNLSATLLAVGALTLGGVAVDDPALVLARGFVERCQNRVAPCAAEPCPADGGFFFSPAVADANKAGSLRWGGAERYHSYGSMTADGLRALLRLGVAPDDRRVVEAAAWLERNFDAARNPGQFAPGAEVRRESAYFYWAWTAAHALRAASKPELMTTQGPVRWAGALAAELVGRQRDDGSWKNAYTEMREDDPVVATSFAMAALTVCRGALVGEYRSHAGWPAATPTPTRPAPGGPEAGALVP